ncbi:MAG: calcium/sodium antiporter [Xanthomonadales bacterium]|jgi:cation:H+ antiporter|nr:calcium/sodium antiporter [Xanthomonadales bacterium]MDH4002894.1 calcium/sodium antiporter [Xanthomonadales bacterium]
MIAYFGIPLGILLLIGGGMALVTGASKIAERFGVPSLIIGLTVVGFGTSAPELIINVIGALRDETALAFGNVVGSNIANLALVLGVAASIRAIEIHSVVVRREIPLLLLVTAVIIVMALDGLLEGTQPRIGRSDSIILFLLFGIFIYIAVQDVIRGWNRDPLLTDIDQYTPVVPAGRFSLGPWFLVLLGFGLLFIGGETTVRSSVLFSERIGVPTSVVGLFVVAVGTSMPELVTSIIAAFRKESDLALGNIIGSNIFNCLIVLPAAGLVRTIPIPQGGMLDLVVAGLLATALIPIFYYGRARLGRPLGIMLVVFYFAYAVFRFSAG